MDQMMAPAGWAAWAAVTALQLADVSLADSQSEPSTNAAPRVVLEVGSPSLVLGVDQETELRIVFAGESRGDGAGPVEMPRVLCNVGRVEDLARTGPREFSARYVLPSERYPQVAILATELRNGAARFRAFSTIRLRAAASPAFHTDPGAQVTLTVAGKEYGPERAPREGTVRIPVVVPPGVGFGLARSVNEYGRSTEQIVDLKLPPFRQMLVMAPESVTAGSVSEVSVYAVDASGTAMDPGAIVLRSPTFRPQPLGGQPGEARFLIRAPNSTADKALQLEAEIRDRPDTQVAMEVPLVGGPPAKLILQPDRHRLPIGPQSSMRLHVAATDGYGNATDVAGVAVFADGVRLETQPQGRGRAMAVVPAPWAYAGQEYLQIEAVAGEAYAAERIALTGIPVTRPVARDPGADFDRVPRFVVTPRLGFVWSFHQPPGLSAFVEALGRPPGWFSRFLLGFSAGYLRTDFPVQDSFGISRVSFHQMPLLAVCRWQHRATRRLQWALGAGVGAELVSGTLESYGFTIPMLGVAPAVESAAELALLFARGELVLGARHLFAPIGTLSSGDRFKGNGAGLVADLGYRFIW